MPALRPPDRVGTAIRHRSLDPWRVGGSSVSVVKLLPVTVACPREPPEAALRQGGRHHQREAAEEEEDAQGTHRAVFLLAYGP